MTVIRCDLYIQYLSQFTVVWEGVRADNSFHFPLSLDKHFSVICI
jgi:hypothetical protein